MALFDRHDLAIPDVIPTWFPCLALIACSKHGGCDVRKAVAISITAALMTCCIPAEEI